MTRQEAEQHLKDLYQLDPCDGSRWAETADIEEVLDIAALNGRAYMARHVVTWEQGNGYTVQRG